MSRTYLKTCDKALVNPFNTGLNSEATQIVLYDVGFCIYVIVFVFSVVFSFMGIGPLGITLAIIGHDLPKLQSANAGPCSALVPRWSSDCPARDSGPLWAAVFLLLFAFWTGMFSCCWGFLGCTQKRMADLVEKISCVKNSCNTNFS